MTVGWAKAQALYILNGLFYCFAEKKMQKMFSLNHSVSLIFSSQLSQAIYAAHPQGSVGGKD